MHAITMPAAPEGFPLSVSPEDHPAHSHATINGARFDRECK